MPVSFFFVFSRNWILNKERKVFRSSLPIRGRLAQININLQRIYLKALKHMVIQLS